VKNVPNEFFYITPSYTIIYHIKATKTMNIPNTKIIRISPEKIYRICTDIKRFILVNNVLVLTCKYNEWVRKNENSNMC
jgi:ribonuclease HIII